MLANTVGKVAVDGAQFSKMVPVETLNAQTGIIDLLLSILDKGAVEETVKLAANIGVAWGTVIIIHGAAVVIPISE